MTYIKHIFTPEEKGTANVPISEWTELYTLYKETHLKQAALDTVIGKIKSAATLVDFRSRDSALNYLFNHSPNDNMNSVDFKTKLIEKLLLEGECLVVPINNKLYIADSFNVFRNKEMAPYHYKDIVIGELALNKTYYANEVFHFKYFNEKLTLFLKQLDESYSTLFSRLVDVHMREQQLRLFAQFKFLKSSDKSQAEQMAEFKKYLSNIKAEIEKESVAILPRQLDYDIEERSQSFLGRSVTELGDLENMYVKQVANALQVPPLLFSGDLADISQHREAFVQFCIKPIIQIIVNEVNAKYFTEAEIKADDLLKYSTINLLYNSELEMGKDIRTMMESAVWTIDDINELMGKPRENTSLTTRRFITRNMAPLNDDGSMQMK
ncbi:phage portal protein [Facklamia sp. P13069]|uniref:phage portal protein n=1 Tax=Facklamia sp. P13069 TaxID=3421954 RepID=UPI003D16B17A